MEHRDLKKRSFPPCLRILRPNKPPVPSLFPLLLCEHAEQSLPQAHRPPEVPLLTCGTQHALPWLLGFERSLITRADMMVDVVRRAGSACRGACASHGPASHPGVCLASAPQLSDMLQAQGEQGGCRLGTPTTHAPCRTLTALLQVQQSKLVLLGEMGSGKTSLVSRFVRGQFYENQVCARGARRRAAGGWRAPVRSGAG